MAPRLEVGIDALDVAKLAEFWATALDYKIGDLDRAGVYLDLVPPNEKLPVIYLQQVVIGKATEKNRLHLDLYVSDAEAEIERLLAVGARRLGSPQTGSEGGWWQVMADPEGNEFCVCQENSRE